MDEPEPAEPLARIPTVADLRKICQKLNDAEAQYVVIGGFAIIYHGFIRATADIDLLVDASDENVRRIKAALEFLPDKAVLDLADADVRENTVVRIADEIVIDLLQQACNIDYEQAKGHILRELDAGVEIPYLDAEWLLKTKATARDKDTIDREFLKDLIAQKKRGL